MDDKSGLVTMPLMTVSEAAVLLGVGKKIVYQLIENGQLRVVKDKGVAYVEKRSVEDFKASGLLT